MNMRVESDEKMEKYKSKVRGLERDVERLRKDRQRFKSRCEKLERDVRALKSRRWWRIGVEGKRALKEPRKLVLLPVRLVKIALGRDIPQVDRGEDSSSKERAGRQACGSDIEAAREAFRRGRYEEANAIAEGLIAKHCDDVKALEVSMRALTQQGEITDAARKARLLRKRSGGRGEAIRERMAVGRVRELDPKWLPRVPGAVESAGGDSDRGLRVLHLLKGCYPYETSGATMRSLAVLSSQRVNGIEPVALIDPAFCADKGMRAGIGYETMEGIPHHYISFGSNLDLQSVPLDQQLMHYAYRASEVVRREQPRVLHANSGRRGYDNAMVALALGWKFNLPVIYEVRSFHEATWTAEVDRAERSELYEKRLAAEEKCLALSDGIVTLSKGMKEDLVARGVPEERIWVIPNAVERERFYPSGRGRQLRREWGIGDAPVLGYVSNLSWREGHDILIRAFNELVREGRDVYCLIVGDGPERSRLEELCKALGVRDRTMFTGTIDREEVAGYYEVIDIFAVPRRDDRAARLVTPLKPFEAMAAGSALVVSDLPALREIVGDGLRGRMFTAGDCRDLARQARVLLENPEKRKRNAESAQAWVESERTWRVNAETYRELYESLVGAK